MKIRPFSSVCCNSLLTTNTIFLDETKMSSFAPSLSVEMGLKGIFGVEAKNYSAFVCMLKVTKNASPQNTTRSCSAAMFSILGSISKPWHITFWRNSLTSSPDDALSVGRSS